MFTKKTIKDVPIKNQTILLKEVYDVPLAADGTISDDLRIRASLPTIQYILDHQAAKIIIISHLGRPGGHPDPALSLAQVAIRLQSLLPSTTVDFVGDTTGPEVEQAVENMPEGSILLLENLRFSPGEEKDSEDFASELVASTHADLFIQDGFAVAHRAHASITAITRLLPSVAGLLLEQEVTSLTAAASNPAHPFLVIVGGAKIADKQPLIDRFVDTADHIAVAGKIAADGYQPTASNIIIPSGFVEDPSGAKLDIDPASTGKIIDLINTSATIIWSGLTGKAEDPDYAASSIAIAEAIGQRRGATTIICGGDTSGFVETLAAHRPDLSYTLISTGGSASLELLSGLPLPGVEALEDK